MKVAILGPFNEGIGFGGVESHVHFLSLALEKAGIEVERVSWKGCGEKAKRVGLLSLGKAMRETDADIIHLHSTATVFYSVFQKPKKKVVATIHSFFHPEYESSLRMKAISSVFGYPYARGLAKADARIAVSRFVKKEAEERGIVADTVIGNGIPLSEIGKTEAAKELESDVIMVGRFTEQKGVFDFINAFSGSRERAVLAGYGDRGVEGRVSSLCKKGGIRLLIRPERGALLSAIASSRVFAFPSKYEPFGIVGIEALALGKPVVVYSGSGGPLDFVSDGKNGKIVDGNPDSLRSAVRSLLENKEELGKMSKNALKTAERYDWDAIADETKKFYSAVLEK